MITLEITLGIALGLTPSLSAQAPHAELSSSDATRLELPQLEPGMLPAWRAHLLPNASELAYAAVEWIPSFAGGLRRADAEGRPLLFWAMNGHPLGCT